ncbi:acyltransferase family protein [uncultured Alistipes sp.]|uniref:acyltransferase family protein n=1 Tax=uncultured Alistipes sp. TaxID=538949 RepID=UPI0026E9EFE5|nr:acyltransferase family protein [uncultured Alistipes sp.]
MSSSASSAVPPPRQSNFELLRIIAMFMILVVHADFWLLGLPTLAEFHAAPAGTWTRILIESASIGCVNIFILISGWFSIRVSVRGFCSFLFQCAFFLLGFYLLMIIAGQEQPGLRQLAPYLCFTKANWFIKAYIGLYILAPMLNLFAETATKRQLALTLLAFYSFQTLYGWTNSAVFVEQGYSTFSFIGLYLLARYLKLHGNPLRGGNGVLCSSCHSQFGADRRIGLQQRRTLRCLALFLRQPAGHRFVSYVATEIRQTSDTIQSCNKPHRQIKFRRVSVPCQSDGFQLHIPQVDCRHLCKLQRNCLSVPDFLHIGGLVLRGRSDRPVQNILLEQAGKQRMLEKIASAKLNREYLLT